MDFLRIERYESICIFKLFALIDSEQQIYYLNQESILATEFDEKVSNLFHKTFSSFDWLLSANVGVYVLALLLEFVENEFFLSLSGCVFLSLARCSSFVFSGGEYFFSHQNDKEVEIAVSHNEKYQYLFRNLIMYNYSLRQDSLQYISKRCRTRCDWVSHIKVDLIFIHLSMSVV